MFTDRTRPHRAALLSNQPWTGIESAEGMWIGAFLFLKHVRLTPAFVSFLWVFLFFIFRVAPGFGPAEGHSGEMGQPAQTAHSPAVQPCRQHEHMHRIRARGPSPGTTTTPLETSLPKSEVQLCLSLRIDPLLDQRPRLDRSTVSNQAGLGLRLPTPPLYQQTMPTAPIDPFYTSLLCQDLG